MDTLNDLIGKKILNIYMNEDYLQFVTDGGAFTYTVEGDCYSRSVFYDFVGVRKLLDNGSVLAVSELQLGEAEEDGDRKKDYHNSCISLYGYSITTEDPNFGPVTSVFSFRNYSNGYYGGWMEECDNREVQPEITDDVVETSPPSPERHV